MSITSEETNPAHGQIPIRSLYCGEETIPPKTLKLGAMRCVAKAMTLELVFLQDTRGEIPSMYNYMFKIAYLAGVYRSAWRESLRETQG